MTWYVSYLTSLNAGSLSILGLKFALNILKRGKASLSNLAWQKNKALACNILGAPNICSYYNRKLFFPLNTSDINQVLSLVISSITCCHSTTSILLHFYWVVTNCLCLSSFPYCRIRCLILVCFIFFLSKESSHNCITQLTLFI